MGRCLQQQEEQRGAGADPRHDGKAAHHSGGKESGVTVERTGAWEAYAAHVHRVGEEGGGNQPPQPAATMHGEGVEWVIHLEDVEGQV